MTRLVIIGGGAAGLSCALALLDTFRARGGRVEPLGSSAAVPSNRSPGGSGALSLCILESREQVGGRIGTEQHGGFVVETGAATIPESAPGFLELTSRLGLSNELLFSDDRAAQRYLWRAGALRRLPSKPPEILTTQALSLLARLRLLGEPLVAARLPSSDGSEESVGDFFRRRLGARATAELVEPALGGIYAGDLDALEMRSALPKIWQMERQHGSLLLALRQSRLGSGGNRLCGFRHGLGQLTTALARCVTEAGGELRLGQAATDLRREGSGYRIGLGDGQLIADRVVLAVPPPVAAQLLKPLDEPLSGLYAAIPMSPLVVITLGWPREQVPHPLDGFGFLVPQRERQQGGPQLLGALFMTSALPTFEQAPRGQVLVRAMYGGLHNPQLTQLYDGELLELVRRDLRTTLGIWAEPRFIHIQRWPHAVEQLVSGHAARVANIEARLEGLDGLYTVGAGLYGVGVPDTLRTSREIGARIAAQLRK